MSLIKFKSRRSGRKSQQMPLESLGADDDDDPRDRSQPSPAIGNGSRTTTLPSNNNNNTTALPSKSIPSPTKGDDNGTIDDDDDDEELVTEPGPNDVLCGRGGAINCHPGNVRFRALCASHKPRYLAASKGDKPEVARDVVREWRAAAATATARSADHSPSPGRFLARVDKTNRESKWREVGDKRAREKASQCLRERNGQGNEAASKLVKTATRDRDKAFSRDYATLMSRAAVAKTATNNAMIQGQMRASESTNRTLNKSMDQRYPAPSGGSFDSSCQRHSKHADAADGNATGNVGGVFNPTTNRIMAKTDDYGMGNTNGELGDMEDRLIDAQIQRLLLLRQVRRTSNRRGNDNINIAQRGGNKRTRSGLDDDSSSMSSPSRKRPALRGGRIPMPRADVLAPCVGEERALREYERLFGPRQVSENASAGRSNGTGHAGGGGGLPTGADEYERLGREQLARLDALARKLNETRGGGVGGGGAIDNSNAGPGNRATNGPRLEPEGASPGRSNGTGSGGQTDAEEYKRLRREQIARLEAFARKLKGGGGGGPTDADEYERLRREQLARLEAFARRLNGTVGGGSATENNNTGTSSRPMPGQPGDAMLNRIGNRIATNGPRLAPESASAERSDKTGGGGGPTDADEYERLRREQLMRLDAFARRLNGMAGGGGATGNNNAGTSSRPMPRQPGDATLNRIGNRIATNGPRLAPESASAERSDKTGSGGCPTHADEYERLRREQLARLEAFARRLNGTVGGGSATENNNTGTSSQPMPGQPGDAMLNRIGNRIATNGPRLAPESASAERSDKTGGGGSGSASAKPTHADEYERLRREQLARLEAFAGRLNGMAGGGGATDNNNAGTSSLPMLQENQNANRIVTNANAAAAEDYANQLLSLRRRVSIGSNTTTGGSSEGSLPDRRTGRVNAARGQTHGNGSAPLAAPFVSLEHGGGRGAAFERAVSNINYYLTAANL